MDLGEGDRCERTTSSDEVGIGIGIIGMASKTAHLPMRTTNMTEREIDAEEEMEMEVEVAEGESTSVSDNDDDDDDVDEDAAASDDVVIFDAVDEDADDEDDGGGGISNASAGGMAPRPVFACDGPRVRRDVRRSTSRDSISSLLSNRVGDDLGMEMERR
jgi:hypothetical protein